MTNAKPRAVAIATATCNAPEGKTHVDDGIFDHVCVCESANALRSQYNNAQVYATAWTGEKGFHTLEAGMLRCSSRLGGFRLGRSGSLGSHERILNVWKLLE